MAVDAGHVATPEAGPGELPPSMAAWVIGDRVLRPVLWRTMGVDGVAAAHQVMRDNQHLGKIAILVRAEDTGLGRTADGPGAIYAEVGA